MIIKPITYKDFNGNERTENHCFHLSKLDRTKFMAKYNLQKVMAGEEELTDPYQIITMLDEIIIKSHGVRSDDGKRFNRDDTFADSAAYEALMNELMFGDDTDDKVIAFMKGVIGEDA